MNPLSELKRCLHAYLDQASTVAKMKGAGLTVEKEEQHIEREVLAIAREIERMKNQGVSL